MKRAREVADPAVSGGKKPHAGADGQPKVRDALTYLERVKMKFGQRPEVYAKFLDIMKDFKAHALPTEGVIKKVKQLFKGHRSLILGFNQFLPQGFRIEMPRERPPAPPAPAQPAGQNIEFNQAVTYVAKIKNRFKNEPHIYSEFLDILHEYQAKRAIEDVYHRVQKLFENAPDLLDEFKFFLPEAASAAANHMFDTGAAESKSTGKRTHSEFKRNKRMYDGRHERGSSPRRDAKERRRLYADSVIQVIERIKQSVTKAIYAQFLKVSDMWNNGTITRDEYFKLVADLFGDKYADLNEKFQKEMEYEEWSEFQLMAAEKTSLYAMVRTQLTKWPIVTPSYREIPAGAPEVICSHRSKLAESVLNDQYISTTSGSEDFSFKASRKNNYEDILFRCEDERYDLDMAIELNASVIRVLDPIIQQIEAMSPEQARRFQLPASVGVLHQKSIRTMYDTAGPDVLDQLRKNPAVAIPVILQRCRQKDVEWRRIRNEKKSEWRKLTEINYPKSLDHRSFYFKQEDRKRLIRSNVVSQLRDVHNHVFLAQKEQQDDLLENDVTRHLEGNLGPEYTYCMRFGYGEQSIHEDLYGVILHVVESVCEPAEVDKVMQFWHNFVHHFLNIQVDPAKVVRPPPKHRDDRDESSSSDDDAEAQRLRAKREVTSDEPGVHNKARERAAAAAAAAAAASAGGAGANGGDDPMDEDPRADDNGAVSDEFDNGDMFEAPIRVRIPNPKFTPKVLSRREAEPAASPSPPPQPLLIPVLPSPRAVGGPARAQVKPARVIMDDFVLPTNTTPVRKHTRPSRLLFGDGDLYVFFRLHQLLYHRLAKAKELAFKHKIRANTDASKKRGKKKKRRPDPTTPEEAHQQFRTLLYELLDEDVDANRYEDECRALLGAGSYVLFTIDKLVQGLVKLVRDLVSSPLCIKLLELYSYEFTRAQDGPMTEDRSAELARMYHSNAARLIPDDVVVQMELFDDVKELAFGLVEGAVKQEGVLVSAGWVGYMQAYLAHTAKAATQPKSRIFLKRTLRESQGSVEIVNNLLVHVNASSFKLHFGEDTADIMIRRRKAGAKGVASPSKKSSMRRRYDARATRARAWHTHQFAIVFPSFDHAQDHAFLEDYQRGPSPDVAAYLEQVSAQRLSQPNRDDSMMELGVAVDAAGRRSSRPVRTSRRLMGDAPDDSRGPDAGDDGDFGAMDVDENANEAGAEGDDADADAAMLLADAGAAAAAMEAVGGDGAGATGNGEQDEGDAATNGAYFPGANAEDGDNGGDVDMTDAGATDQA